MENVPELCEEVRTNMNAVLKDISDEVLKRSETVSGKKTE
jgi:hypothetical protein